MKEGDLVLCTVEQVNNNITHVRLPNGDEGTIVSSEIAPGRIKHLRHYVFPNKKIVCKILQILGENIHLSLRRVSSKEKKEIMQEFKQEQAISVALNQLLTSPKEIIKKIRSNFESLTDFTNKAKNNPRILEEYIPKKNQEAIKKIIEKKRRERELKQKINLKCLQENGIKKIKKIFEFNDSSLSITYISAGNFNLKLAVEDFKQGKKRMNGIIETIEKRAKKENCEFSSSER